MAEVTAQVDAALREPLALEVGGRAERLLGRMATAIGDPFFGWDAEVRERLLVLRAWVTREVFGITCVKGTLSTSTTAIVAYVPLAATHWLPMRGDLQVAMLADLHPSPEGSAQQSAQDTAARVLALSLVGAHSEA